MVVERGRVVGVVGVDFFFWVVGVVGALVDAAVDAFVDAFVDADDCVAVDDDVAVETGSGSTAGAMVVPVGTVTSPTVASGTAVTIARSTVVAVAAVDGCLPPPANVSTAATARIDAAMAPVAIGFELATWRT